MSKGFAHPYLLIAVLALVGAGFAVFAGSNTLSGLVLGSRSYNLENYQNKTDGLKVIVISPNVSWDLMQYICKTRDECEQSTASGKWWATVSGAPTTEDGHEVFIEKSPGWGGYGFLKVVVRKAGSASAYLLEPSGQGYFLYDLAGSGNSAASSSVVFR